MPARRFQNRMREGPLDRVVRIEIAVQLVPCTDFSLSAQSNITPEIQHSRSYQVIGYFVLRFLSTWTGEDEVLNRNLLWIIQSPKPCFRFYYAF
jgi:hypothetical protein